MKKKYKLKCYEGNHPRINISEDFIKRNNLSLARSQEEIVERFVGKSKQAMDFESEVLFNYLNFENAEEFLKEEYVKKVESGKKKWERIPDIYETAQDFLDYMVFGWMKALDERGISASRTIDKCGAWLWLMGRDDLRSLIHDDELYNPYGVPALIAVCEKMGIEIPNDLRNFSKRKCE